MSDEEGSETPSPSRIGGQDAQEESSDGDAGSPCTPANGDLDGDLAPLRPHELIPAHIKDKEKIEVSATAGNANIQQSQPWVRLLARTIA